MMQDFTDRTCLIRHPDTFFCPVYTFMSRFSSIFTSGGGGK